MSHSKDRSSFLEGGGELGALMRAHDWRGTPLGAPESWPRALKTAVRIMLTSRQPFWLGWGTELTYLYNDPYKSIIGGKHPWALGRPFREVWSEIYGLIGPMADRVMTRNEGTYVESQLLIMERYGYPEETYYTYSYSPIPNDEGGIGGLICANTDDTRRVIGERQLATLGELGTRAASAKSGGEACVLSVQALESNARDLPFVLLFAEGDGAPKLEAATAGARELGRSDRWPMLEAIQTRDLQTVHLDASFGEIPAGAWPHPPSQAAVVPIPAAGRPRRILVAGLNPFRQFDESYRRFLELIGAQVASAIANAEAFEETKKRAEALAELDRAKTAFFSNVSHEFRTPLTLMLGPVEESLADAEHPLSAPQRERQELVHRNGQRLLKLVNTLLDFARIEAGRAQASYEPVDLGVLTVELASNFRAACERAGLELQVQCPAPSEPAYVDREMWEKIVLNLVSNAFKFTLQGGIEIGLKETDANFVLSVRDTGGGIAEAELPRMFERFHRIEGAGGRSHEGSGIGLALVYELVKLHGGSISVQSSLGQGSVFTVTLPKGSAHLPAERRQVRAPTPRPRIVRARTWTRR